MSHLSGSAASPTEPESPHGALFLVLHYLQVRELLAFQSVSRIFCDTISNDPSLWREITVQSPLSSKLTDEALLAITSRAEGTLRSLTLFSCLKISDAGLLTVVEQNPGITKLFVPGCICLTADGMVEVVKRLHERKGNVNQLRLRLRGLCNIEKDHLDVLNSFLCKDGLLSKSLMPSFYGSNHSSGSINSDDGRPIDVDMCPMCRTVRLVFDCTRDECRRMERRWIECRGCFFCIARCEDCGGCIDPENMCHAESACNHLLCIDCWLQLPKCDTCNRPYCKGHNSFVGPTTGFICQECADGDFLDNVPEAGF
ncbi:F-box protein SKIP28-like protein [Carex littledalei]|uniref:F-box protein SKIP28-like protein n=1 Tax=Carex littledalei TaxID=544730 RepID=A0A833VIL5_9POAL|nr:F-box protein SKIP28-like protein [Carex littledalei]